MSKVMMTESGDDTYYISVVMMMLSGIPYATVHGEKDTHKDATCEENWKEDCKEEPRIETTALTRNGSIEKLIKCTYIRSGCK
jgi:hypothetical protein